MNRRFLEIGLEILLIVATLLMGWKVIIGEPTSVGYADDVIMPYSVIYIGLYALKIFILRVQSKLKYLFYVAFGALMLGLRFYAQIELTASIKFIAIGCVALLLIYHILSLFRRA